MNETTETGPDDISASHSLLNTLHSGLTGCFVFHQALESFKELRSSEETKFFAERTLQKTTKWLEELYNGTAFVSRAWTAVETFDAKMAFDALEKVKQDLDTLLKELQTFEKDPKLFFNLDNIKYLYSCHLRLAHSRCEFLKHYKEFATRNLPEGSEQPSIEPILQEIKELEEVGGLLSNNATLPPQGLIKNIGERSQRLRSVFAVQRHEILILLAMYSGGPTFALMEIGEEEGGRWSSCQFEPVSAGYWRAHNIGPEEAVAWVHGGVIDPGAVVMWRDLLFSPMDTAPWVQAGIPPVFARRWKDEGFSPSQALEFIQKGTLEPPKKTR